MKKINSNLKNRKALLKSGKRRSLHAFFWGTLLLSSLVGCTGSSHEDQKSKPLGFDPHKTWRDYGGGPDQSKYFVQDEINKSNVNQLKEAWFYSAGDDNVYQFNPVIVDSTMYVLAKDNSLVALNATTGKEIWIHANCMELLPGVLTIGRVKIEKTGDLFFR